MADSKKYVSYKIISELNLIIEYLKGPVTSEDAVNMKKLINSDDKYNPNYNLLIDFRDTIINWNNKSYESLMQYIYYLKNNPDLISKRKISFLLSEPGQAVLSTILKDKFTALSMPSGLFSTTEAALNNLDISLNHVNRINSEIEKLKRKPSLIL